MAKAWILIGMMGAGKSSVGRSLSALSGRPFKDTDQLIQNRFGRPISKIFEVYGEDAFREHETSVLRGLEPEEIVLSTGGGIILRPENWEELRRLGTIIYLESGIETLTERLRASKKKRPLLDVEDWESRLSSILETRIPLYEQADIKISLDDYGVDDAAQVLYAKLMDTE